MVVSANISRYQQRFNMTEFRQSLEVGLMIIDHKSRFFEACVKLNLFNGAFQYDLDDENREDESRVGIPSLQDLLARVRQPATSTGFFLFFCSHIYRWQFFFIFPLLHFYFLLFCIFSFTAAPESDSLSADSLAFVLVYGFVLAALGVYVGLRLYRRWRQFF